MRLGGREVEVIVDTWGQGPSGVSRVPCPKAGLLSHLLSMERGQGSWAIAPQCRMTPLSPPDLSASVNGEATSQKGGSTEDKEQEEGQNLEEGPVGGSSEDLLHNE